MVSEVERTNGKRKRGTWRRKRVRRRRESSSYYKWQSLPGAYDKSLSALPGIEISPVNPSIAVTMGRSACHHLVTTLHQLKDLFTGSNTAESSNFQDNIRSTTVPSPLLHLSFEIISYIIHQVPLCGRYLLVWYKYSIF